MSEFKARMDQGRIEKDNANSSYQEQDSNIAVNDIAAVPLLRERIINTTPASRLVVDGEEEELLLPVVSLATRAIDYNDPSYLDYTLVGGQISSTIAEGEVTTLEMLPCAYGDPGDYTENIFRLQENARMALLRIRDLKPHLFSEPLPYSDKEILDSPLYRGILVGDGMIDDGLTSGGRELESDAYFAVDLHTKNAKLFDFLRRVRDAHTAVNRRGKK